MATAGPLSSPMARAWGAAAADMPITEAAAAAATIAFLSTSRSFRRSDALSYGLINPVRDDWFRAFTRLAPTGSGKGRRKAPEYRWNPGAAQISRCPPTG
ncbi:hypothetical protein GCM10010220_21480 [Streptomyces parvulus]|nr:hypothetical protein GCM10010220_21480 [Streptomyces parvulus]